MNPELHKAIVDVHAAAEGLGIKAVLVGALMMEFTTEVGADYPPPKRTNDADFAVFVADWAAFERLRASLEAKEYVRSPKVEHRLTNKDKTVLIDLIPAGDAIAKGGEIVWPESEHVMTVVGFPEVCAAATTKVKAGLPEVPVITVPGFVLLKIIAFQERFENQDLKYINDVEHLAYWLEHYASIADKDDRRFEFLERKGWRDLDINLAGAAMLGDEVKRLASPEAAKRIRKFLEDSAASESPFIETLVRLKRSMADEEARNRVREEGVEWLKAFQRGFEAT